MRTVLIAGVGMTRFGVHLDRSLREMAMAAAGAALDDAGRGPGDVQAAFFANAFAGLLTGQEAVRGQVALRGALAAGAPVFNIEGACASSAVALDLAALAVAAGRYDRVLVVGAEKLCHPDRALPPRALATAADVAESRGAPRFFMDLYARRARAYAQRSGATERHFATVAAKNRAHGARNPYARHQAPVTVEEVLCGPVIAAPLTRLMCSPIADGAAALLLEAAPAAGPGAVRVLATSVVGGGAGEHLVTRAARAAYARAGVGPEDVDAVELHDGAAPAELEVCERLGLCAPGEGVAMLERGDTALGGRLPVNPGGGLCARGHPVGATGAAQVVELAWQLRGQGGARQVEGARVALAESAGGWVGGDTAVGAVTILGRS